MSYQARYIDWKGIERMTFIDARDYKEAEEKAMSMDGIYVLKSVKRADWS